MAITYKHIDPESGVRWCVRIVFWGDNYGRDFCLTYNDDPDINKFWSSLDSEYDPLIEFYDMESSVAKSMRESEDKRERYMGEEYGQFVSRYYLSTLNENDGMNKSNGLNLYGGVDRWGVSGEFMDHVMDVVNEAVEERFELDRRSREREQQIMEKANA